MKKSILAIAALLVFSFTSFAQMTITPYVQGDFSHFATFPEQNEKESAKEYRQDMFRPKISYTTGIAINYALNEKWEIKSGLIFQEMGAKIPYTEFPAAPGSSFNAYKITHHHQFLAIPVQAQYNFSSDHKFQPYIAFGGDIRWNTKNYYRSKTYNDGELANYTKEEFVLTRQKINFSIKSDIGFQYQLLERLSLNTFFSGNILLLPTIQNDIFNIRHFNIGIGAGVAYSI
jgi:hypothetical protein